EFRRVLFRSMAAGMNEGFDFVAIGRALLREPGLIRAVHADHSKKSLCTHCNRCMYTVYGRTHCVLDPESAYSAAGEAPTIDLSLPSAPLPAGSPLLDARSWRSVETMTDGNMVALGTGAGQGVGHGIAWTLPERGA